jgi:hypothetical protein
MRPVKNAKVLAKRVAQKSTTFEQIEVTSPELLALGNNRNIICELLYQAHQS